jgi:hypothetical protein
MRSLISCGLAEKIALNHIRISAFEKAENYVDFY